MREDIKKLWVDALRSGKYLQGHGRLAASPKHLDKIEYCCLGVLCEVLIDNHIVNLEKKEHDEGDFTSIFFDENNMVLPEKVKNIVGVSDFDIVAIDDYEKTFTTNLAEHNDNGATFEEIADIIEKQL